MHIRFPLRVAVLLASTSPALTFVGQTAGHQRRRHRLPPPLPLWPKGDELPETSDDLISENNNAPTNRRFLIRSLAVQAALLTAVSGFSMSDHQSPAYAFDTNKRFPVELKATDASDLDSRQRKVNSIREKEAATALNADTARPLGAALWGSALWFLSGSRSNPLVTPLANILYDPDKEDWLKDRNDGLFANVPAALLVALAIIFLFAGGLTDMLVVLVADGDDRNTSLQLAGVSLLGGASLELGRIASGEKAATRNESDRAVRLQVEFTQFAQERLLPGGNCHRTDVVRAFRRYFSKYRQADDSGADDSAVSDLEIEQLLRQWGRTQARVKMSSAGFYSGIQINRDADVFGQR